MKKFFTYTTLIIALFQSIQTIENRHTLEGFPDAFTIIKTIAETLIDKEGLLDEIPHLQTENLNETFEGWTPLSIALYRNLPLVTQDLLRSGARLETALKHAIDYDFVTALACLLPLTNYAINDFVIDAQGNTLLTYALTHKKDLCVFYMYSHLDQESIEPLKALRSMILLDAKTAIDKLALRFPAHILNNYRELLINALRDDTTPSNALFLKKISTITPLLLIETLVFLNKEHPNLLNQKNALNLIQSVQLETLKPLINPINQKILSTFLDLKLKNIKIRPSSLLNDLILLAQTAQTNQCSRFKKTCLFWIESYFLKPLIPTDDVAMLQKVVDQLTNAGLSLSLSNLYANALAVNAVKTAQWLSQQPACSVSLNLLLSTIEEDNAPLVQEHLRNFLERLDITSLSDQDFMTLLFDLENELKDTIASLEDPSAHQSWQTFYTETIQPFLAQYVQK